MRSECWRGEASAEHVSTSSYLMRGVGLKAMVHVYPIFGALNVPQALNAFNVMSGFLKSGVIDEFRPLEIDNGEFPVGTLLSSGRESLWFEL